MERIPILRMGNFLLVTIQVDMHDKLALTLQDDLTAKIADVGAKGVLIDISSLEIVDSFIGRTLANIASMARVLDAQTVVVGMQPAVAITLVELGMSLPGIRTALNVESGMQYLQETASVLTETARTMTGTVSKTEKLPIKDSSDVVFVRQRVRVWATDLKLSLVDQTKIVTAASELGRNTLEHGGGGELEIAEVVEGTRKGIRLSFSDKGPGIADVKQALTDGFTSKQGMGLGAWGK